MASPDKIASTTGVTWVPAEPDRRQRERPPRREPRRRRRVPKETPEPVTYRPGGRLSPALPGPKHIDIVV
ncbi:hypothetical protein GQ464_008275 [Rhodocaloribacter litoris]|uniref:hypothetical protein n=1 Tax=Rhodocaloribacter litoris TaxID=2558931 RepID=UPI001420C83A|nr:hypothetical protein [Rhodocaloribacter litoris]QXD16916.1 hypothetical protein GQ464_008275 [Rhodocaloribacter litoris]